MGSVGPRAGLLPRQRSVDRSGSTKDAPKLRNKPGKGRQLRLFQNPFDATGFPLTEAYWTRVQVAGVPRWVLVQAFERQVLTYTPENLAGWQIEFGNVGQHYYEWRYDRQLQGFPAPILPYQDDFSNPKSGWSSYQDSDRSVGYTNGGYRILVLKPKIRW